MTKRKPPSPFAVVDHWVALKAARVQRLRAQKKGPPAGPHKDESSFTHRRDARAHARKKGGLVVLRAQTFLFASK